MNSYVIRYENKCNNTIKKFTREQNQFGANRSEEQFVLKMYCNNNTNIYVVLTYFIELNRYLYGIIESNFIFVRNSHVNQIDTVPQVHIKSKFGRKVFQVNFIKIIPLNKSGRGMVQKNYTQTCLIIHHLYPLKMQCGRDPAPDDNVGLP